MASPTPGTLSALSDEIASSVATIEAYLTAQSRPPLSFLPPANAQELPSFGHEDLQTARETLIRNARTLVDLALGPRAAWTLHGHNAIHDLSAYKIIDHFKLQDLIPLEPPGASISYEELAAKTGVDIHRARGALRHAMTSRLFCEPEVGRVAHSALSAQWVQDPTAKAFAEFYFVESAKWAGGVRGALEKWGPSLSPTETSINFVEGLEGHSIAAVAGGKNAQIFGDTMRWSGGGGGLQNAHAVNGYPWEELRWSSGDGVKIVDVGGGTGHFSIELAQKFPWMSFVVQDLADALPAASAIPAEVSDRIETQVHDFFTPQKVEADAYMLRFILHDWSTPEAAKILDSLVPALRPGVKVLLIEGVLDNDALVDSNAHLRSGVNLQMMVLFNAHERTREDWEEVVEIADKRFKLTRIITPPASFFSILELTFG